MIATPVWIIWVELDGVRYSARNAYRAGWIGVASAAPLSDHVAVTDAILANLLNGPSAREAARLGHFDRERLADTFRATAVGVWTQQFTD